MDKANEIVNSACIWVTEHPKMALTLFSVALICAWLLG